MSDKSQFTEQYGYAPFRFSCLHLRTVMLFFRTKEASFVYQDKRGFFNNIRFAYIIRQSGLAYRTEIP